MDENCERILELTNEDVHTLIIRSNSKQRVNTPFNIGIFAVSATAAERASVVSS